MVWGKMMRIKQVLPWLFMILAAMQPLIFTGIAYAAPPLRDCSGVSVFITSPNNGQSVDGSFPIIGTATLPGKEFRYYKLEFAVAGSNAWAVIVNNVRHPVVNNVLATVNASAVAPGDYTLRLLAVDQTGNYCEALASVRIGAGAPIETPIASAGSSSRGNNSSAVSALATPIEPIAAAALSAEPAAPVVPTVVVDLPKAVPGADSIFTTSSGKSGLPFTPPSWGAVGDSASVFAGQLSHQFIFGMQAMAGLFILLGMIVFVRRNL